MGSATCCMAENKTLLHLRIACLAAQPQAACTRTPCFAVLLLLSCRHASLVGCY